MPASAKRVFRGLFFDVYQWNQRLFDGSTATYEKISRRDTAIVIPVTADKKIVVNKEIQSGDRFPFFSLPGGVLDPDETPLQAAKRELLEETGYRAKSYKQLQAFEPSARIEWKAHLFLARGCRKAQDPAPDPGEKIDVRLFSWSEFLDLAAQESFRNFEVALMILRAARDPRALTRFRKKIGM